MSIRPKPLVLAVLPPRDASKPSFGGTPFKLGGNRHALAPVAWLIQFRPFQKRFVPRSESKYSKPTRIAVPAAVLAGRCAVGPAPSKADRRQPFEHSTKA